MKRSFSAGFWTVLLLIALLVLRLSDLLFFCDPITGYLSGGSDLVRAVAAAGVVVFFALLYRVYKQRLSLARPREKSEETNDDAEAEPAFAPGAPPQAGNSFLIAALFLLCAVGVVVYSVFLYRQLGIDSAFSLLFASKQQLLSRGYANGYFKYDLLLCLIGFLAALWFVFSAAWFAKGRGRFLGGRFYSVIVILWLFMRVVRLFFNRSINQHNTLAVAATFAVVVLAVFFTKYAKFTSLDFPKSDLPGLLCWGIVSFLIVVGVNAPGAISHIQVLLMAKTGALQTLTGTAVSVSTAVSKAQFGLVEIASNVLCAALALAICAAFEPKKQQSTAQKEPAAS